MSFERRIDRFCAEYPEAPRDLILASRLLLRSARLLRQHIERALAVHDLDLNQYLVISMLGIDAMEPTMPSELGLTIDATRTQMTRLIDGLETRGLVQRKASQHDRRSLELILTPAAHDLLKRAAPTVHAAYAEAWAPIGKTGLAAVTRDLGRLHQHLAALGANAS
ncbi:MarR family transcriptional regulator, negative regulator of the multidrug operon emrRAB [Cupriavidus metallidurans]|jgi:MarR family transcriptional regulator, negative regulator of the multidrug operon emrRAB|uniref:Transcriptional regulator, MarR-family n=2 Tax=Cupriavidus metallidurans TaxID=119219 RepID=Q1LH81_CUPMC|nr:MULTISPECIES: MarR family transcriptional regulator [Cupriavidus]PCH57050.1 MAG: MarR family transcriptional regulator [Burkholderiaceae bacterium]ABF10495.1 transcriptional regulator, MarR-family [Cupriavidus metallidurans CH34]AVA35459.1 MarR family transcriptional regulator [Cupriavidus metallidurans]EKZ98238.1 MarR family transcriptional regulator [Cupriavidus sp. HMR-1]KWR82485.1 MarR family transcriptional regulator [Cupriavidus sp. SHE]